MSELYSISKAAKYLDVTVSTLRYWDKTGKLRAQRTVGNQRRYSQTMLDNARKNRFFSDNQRAEYAVGYCRVENADALDKLAVQRSAVKDYLQNHNNHVPFEIVMDIGSGNDFQRKGLLEVIDSVCNKQCTQLVMVNAHCLSSTDFGIGVLEEMCMVCGVKKIMLDELSDFDVKKYLNPWKQTKKKG